MLQLDLIPVCKLTIHSPHVMWSVARPTVTVPATVAFGHYQVILVGDTCVNIEQLTKVFI